MKFLNKFWLVAVVSVGLFSCGESPINKTISLEKITDSSASEIETLDTVSDIIKETDLMTVHVLGDKNKSGWNIATKLIADPTDPTNKSILLFYKIKNDGTIVEVADLTKNTVEVYLTGSNNISISTTGSVNDHFDGKYRTYAAKTSVDFKVSRFFAGVAGSRTIVGTEDDRNYVDRKSAYANILFNSITPRKVRFSYVSKGPAEGEVWLSGLNTVISIDILTCEKLTTGVDENRGWGVSYNKCCEAPCLPLTE